MPSTIQVITMQKRKSKKKTKRRIKNKKTIPLNLKSLGSDISKYPFVEIEWADIEGDAGWSSTRSLNKSKLPTCVSKGYLLSQNMVSLEFFVTILKQKIKKHLKTLVIQL